MLASNPDVDIASGQIRTDDRRFTNLPPSLSNSAVTFKLGFPCKCPNAFLSVKYRAVMASVVTFVSFLLAFLRFQSKSRAHAAFVSENVTTGWSMTGSRGITRFCRSTTRQGGQEYGHIVKRAVNWSVKWSGSAPAITKNIGNSI